MLQAAFDHEESFFDTPKGPKAEKLNINEILRFEGLTTYHKLLFSQKCRKSILQHAILCKKIR